MNDQPPNPPDFPRFRGQRTGLDLEDMSLPERSRFFSPTTGVNKVEIVRDALNRSDRVAFAGSFERWSQIADQLQSAEC
jgi:hypothetical protein